MWKMQREEDSWQKKKVKRDGDSCGEKLFQLDLGSIISTILNEFERFFQ